MESLITPRLLRLSKSCIYEAEKKAVLGVLDRGFLGMGEEVKEFEERLSIFFGRPALCVANGTAALQLALEAAGIGLGDEVIVQSLTYVASFQAISATGAIPVSCDVNPKTLTINLNDAANRLTHKTKAIMPVHYSGDPGELNAIYEFARENRLRIIEDSAHAFGSRYQGKNIGAIGDISCFSFDGIKNITSGEGGCIVTDDVEILKKVRDSRLLGVENDSDKRYAGGRSWEFDVTTQGWRYHMSNIMAAIGIEQLNRFPELAFKRKAIAKHYDELLGSNHGVEIFKRNYDELVPHIYVVRLNGLVDREGLRKKLLSRGIQTGVHYFPNHQLTLYKNTASKNLPETEALYPEILSLPLHPELCKADIEIICSSLIEYLQDFRE